MLSMETCISPDGRTISYGVQQSCASLGLDNYHWWQMEPFRHIWMWMSTTAGEIVTMMVICTLLVLVLKAKDYYARTEHGVDQTT